MDDIYQIMDKTMLSNFDLIKLAKHLKIKFNGCLMNDQLKQEYFKKDFFVIINFDNSDGQGKHWVALVNHRKSRTCYYMDSYGELPNQKVYDEIMKSGNNLYFNKVQYQALESMMCGWFSLYFLILMQKPSPNKMKSFLGKFNTKDYHSNDRVIKDIFKKLVFKK
jgi:hypothetical protein